MLDKRQFFIGTERIDGWKTMPFLNDRLLSYEDHLNVVTNHNGVFILGDAWQADPDQRSPYDIIRDWDGTTEDHVIFQAEESWCGKYVLIVGTRVFLDCASMFPVFFDDKSRISSSLRILAEKNGYSLRYPKIKHGAGTCFVPAPCTMYPTIRKVLASQIYVFPSDNGQAELYERPLLPNGIRTKNEETLDKFSACFIHSLKEMRKTLTGRFKVALSGGADSRTLLSLMDKSGIDYSCFTFETEFVHSGGDFELPPMLSRIVHREHTFYRIQKGSYSRAKENEYLKHSAGMAKDSDLFEYSHGVLNEIAGEEDTVVFYSGIWDIAIEYYKRLRKDTIDINDILLAFPDIKCDSVKLKSVYEWLELLAQSPWRHQISDANRAFWEQRDGCWMSCISQAYDVVDHGRMIQPCNCRLFLSYLLGWPEEERKIKAHQKEIIGHNMPELLSVPFTDDYPKPKSGINTKIKNRLTKYYYFTKWYGLRWIR